MATKLIVFTLLIAAAIYLFNCLVARKVKPIDPKMALLYITTVSMIGVVGEIFVDSIYDFFAPNPLWVYNILPVHDGYTSKYAAILWGLFGFYLYLMHDTLDKWSVKKRRHLALIFAFEALVLEAIVVIASKLLLGKWMYYYYPGDLWHVSTIQNFPFYFLCGYLIVGTLRRFKQDPRFFIIINAWIIFVMVIAT